MLCKIRQNFSSEFEKMCGESEMGSDHLTILKFMIWSGLVCWGVNILNSYVEANYLAQQKAALLEKQSKEKKKK